MKRLLIVNYGMGNLKSIQNAAAFLGYKALVSNDAQDIRAADAYFFPGVGAFGQAMANLRTLGIIPLLREEVVEKKKPFLGICLGMQLLAEDSEELGFHEGLGWIKGSVKKISVPIDPEGIQVFRIPHVGWNDVSTTGTSPLFSGIDSGSNYYFDHSYHLVCDAALVAATYSYGSMGVAAIQSENIFATQFHPEKSQVKGLKLIRNFLNHVESVC